ncbi:hypothetical protein A2U01_0078239, partial [Trifolium medium]|nr:hypothetical protein [Trifolium medium]
RSPLSMAGGQLEIRGKTIRGSVCTEAGSSR